MQKPVALKSVFWKKCSLPKLSAFIVIICVKPSKCWAFSLKEKTKNQTTKESVLEMGIITGIYLTFWAMSLSAVLYSSYTLFAPTNKSAAAINGWFIVFSVASAATLLILAILVSSKSLGLNVANGSIGGTVLILITVATIGWLAFKSFIALKDLTGSYRLN